MTLEENKAAPPHRQIATPMGKLATLPRYVCLSRARDIGTRSPNIRSNVMGEFIISPVKTGRKYNHCVQFYRVTSARP